MTWAHAVANSTFGVTRLARAPHSYEHARRDGTRRTRVLVPRNDALDACARAVLAAALLAFSAFAPADAHPPLWRRTSATTRRTRRRVRSRTPRPWRTRASPSAWPGPPPTVASIPSPTRTTRPESSPRCARELVRAANDRTASSDIHPVARTRVAPGRARILTTLALLPSVPDPQARHITTAEYKPGARHTLTVYTPVEGEFILTASAGAFEDFGQRLDGHLGYGLGLGCPDCCGGRRYNVKIHLTENHIIWNAPSNATSSRRHSSK